MQARSVPKSCSCSDCTTLFGPRRPCHMCQLFQFKAIQNNYSVRKIVPFRLPEKWFGLSVLIWKKKQPTNRPNKQTNNQKKTWIPGTIHCKIFCNFGTSSNGFWVTRSHCRDCLFDVTHKEASILSETLHSVMMRGEKNDEKSKWLRGLLNHKSNVIVRAALLSSRHQILLLVLIENPWGPL